MQNCQTILVCGVCQLSIAITTIQVLSLDWLVITQYCTVSMEGLECQGCECKTICWPAVGKMSKT